MCAKFIFKLFVAVSYLLSFVFSVNSFVLCASRVPISWRKSFRGPSFSHHFSIGSCRRFSLFPAVIVGDYYFVELSQLNIVFSFQFLVLFFSLNAGAAPWQKRTKAVVPDSVSGRYGAVKLPGSWHHDDVVAVENGGFTRFGGVYEHWQYMNAMVPENMTSE